MLEKSSSESTSSLPSLFTSVINTHTHTHTHTHSMEDINHREDVCVTPLRSPECGDMKAVWASGAAGPLAALELRDLKPAGRGAAGTGPEELGKPFSQPEDTRNWASGERRAGA